MAEDAVGTPMLASPIALRSVTTRNRIVISPMCQYSAVDGRPDDWHFIHLGRFAMGGAGIVFFEATAVTEQGRITYGDLGLWKNDQVPAFRRIADAITELGGVPAIQLGHAGRKASATRPWDGNVAIKTDNPNGEAPWPTVSASPLPVDEGWHMPRELDPADLESLKDAWQDATRRALEAGIRIVELHCAHGYLLHQFLSPISNQRTDAYGGGFEGRCRFPLEVAEAVRSVWPDELPLFARVSATDWVEGGWKIEDTVRFARELKARGVDVIDCSSGGMTGASVTAAAIPRTPGFQIPFAEQVRAEADIATIGVGLILDGPQAEAILQEGRADLIAVAREALADPNWALHGRQQIAAAQDFSDWPEQAGWWLQRRARSLGR